MKLTIPTDQKLGHQIETIVRIIAIAVAFVYAAGFTFGQAIHWLSANLTQLHTYLLKPTDGYPHPHPVVIGPDVDHRSSVASTPTTTRAKGFAS
ncbi:hypothetical protein [Synechococcus phage S-H1]|nr:hypothetical protein [Synechococcus phage S-H1]